MQFFFPALFWVPTTKSTVDLGVFTLHPRLWNVSIFDLYSMVAEGHPLRMPAELMQIFLPKVNIEISVDASTISEAIEKIDVLRAVMYSEGMTPTIFPFATSYSLNQYAGINSRSSEYLRSKMPEGMRKGIRAKENRVEGWPNELSLSILGATSKGQIDERSFKQAAERAAHWVNLEERFPEASILRSAAIKAPLMPDYSSSVLHIWQALEAVFGKGPELSFRMSLTLAELCGPVAERTETYREVKTSYKDRSGITHGRTRNVTLETWTRTWTVLMLTLRAILHRGAIPSEDDLFSDLLSR